ncbi:MULTISPECIES: transposase [Shewanella]
MRTLKSNFGWRTIFWSDGYFACSTSSASVDTIRQYIQEQG